MPWRSVRPIETPRDQLLDDLATGFGLADFDLFDLLELGNRQWALCTRRACALYPDLALALQSISLADVAERGRQIARDQEARVSQTLPPREMGTLFEEKVRHGLEQRSLAHRLDALVDDVVRGVIEQPPGGRDGWPELWSWDRRRDRHRHATARGYSARG